MPDWPTLSVFVAAAAVLVVLPGPNTLYIVARSLEQGTAAGLVSCLGVLVATLVHVSGAALGPATSALVLASRSPSSLLAGGAATCWCSGCAPCRLGGGRDRCPRTGPGHGAWPVVRPRADGQPAQPEDRPCSSPPCCRSSCGWAGARRCRRSWSSARCSSPSAWSATLPTPSPPAGSGSWLRNRTLVALAGRGRRRGTSASAWSRPAPARSAAEPRHRSGPGADSGLRLPSTCPDLSPCPARPPARPLPATQPQPVPGVQQLRPAWPATTSASPLLPALRHPVRRGDARPLRPAAVRPLRLRPLPQPRPGGHGDRPRRAEPRCSSAGRSTRPATAAAGAAHRRLHRVRGILSRHRPPRSARRDRPLHPPQARHRQRGLQPARRPAPHPGHRILLAEVAGGRAEAADDLDALRQV